MHFSAVCNYTFNGTFLPTGEATFPHSAWIQSSWPDAASPCRQHFQILYSGSIFQQLTDCGRFVPASGAKQPMRLNAWIAFPPCSKDAYFLLKIHTNSVLLVEIHQRWLRDLLWKSDSLWLSAGPIFTTYLLSGLSHRVADRAQTNGALAELLCKIEPEL